MSLMVGLLYGAMLPMLPRHPVLLGGFIAPIMWSGLIYSVLGIVNPVLDQRIDWVWFVISQFGFGIVAGIVVSRQQRIFTSQAVPFAIRMGMEGSGMREDQGGKDQQPVKGRRVVLAVLMLMPACGPHAGGFARGPSRQASRFQPSVFRKLRRMPRSRRQGRGWPSHWAIQFSWRLPMTQ